MNTVYSMFLNNSIFTDLELSSSTFKTMLLIPSYEFGRNHTFSDIKTFEIDKTPSYKEGGKEISLEHRGEDVSKIYVQNQCILWPGLVTSSEFRYAVIYKEDANPENNMPIYCIDLGVRPRIVQPKDLKLTWDDYLLDIGVEVDEACVSNGIRYGELVGYCPLIDTKAKR